MPSEHSAIWALKVRLKVICQFHEWWKRQICLPDKWVLSNKFFKIFASKPELFLPFFSNQDRRHRFFGISSSSSECCLRIYVVPAVFEKYSAKYENVILTFGICQCVRLVEFKTRRDVYKIRAVAHLHSIQETSSVRSSYACWGVSGCCLQDAGSLTEVSRQFDNSRVGSPTIVKNILFAVMAEMDLGPRSTIAVLPRLSA